MRAHPAPNRRGRAWVAGSALMAMAIIVAAAVMVTKRSPAPVALAPSATVVPAAEPKGTSDAPPVVITYRVQRGDSLWRIAASLTGDGRRWRELWPEHATGDGRIRAGAVLRVDARRLSASAR